MIANKLSVTLTTALLTVCLSLATEATAGEKDQQKPDEAEVGETATQALDPCDAGINPDEMIDIAYQYLNTKFCQPALWFDSFFLDDRVEEDSRAGTQVRWGNDFSYCGVDGFKYRAQLNARFHLPGASKKLKLIIDSQGDDDPFAFLRSPDDDGERDIGLRYDWYSSERVSFNIKANLQPKIEARWGYTYPLSEATTTRLTQKLYQKKKVTGESTEFDIEHVFNDYYLLRWSSVAQYETRDNGWEFGSSLRLYHYISPVRALNYIASIYGVDTPYHYVENARIAVTYRQQFLREWLFFEITPEYNWHKEVDEDRVEQVILTLRLEVLFKNF
ncbi:hypothetical protein [Shewanella waksmanii]|uniref:hypothetical protein n=1 Tax=Shewanella waksmanii TaxID=213783 RepID=UPI0004B3302A|nr:hypothetical protein [Shewanella waksmanii]